MAFVGNFQVHPVILNLLNDCLFLCSLSFSSLDSIQICIMIKNYDEFLYTQQNKELRTS